MWSNVHCKYRVSKTESTTKEKAAQYSDFLFFCFVLGASELINDVFYRNTIRENKASTRTVNKLELNLDCQLQDKITKHHSNTGISIYDSECKTTQSKKVFCD